MQKQKERKEGLTLKLVNRLAKMMQKRHEKMPGGTQKKMRMETGETDEEAMDPGVAAMEVDEEIPIVASSQLLRAIALGVDAPKAHAIGQVGDPINLTCLESQRDGDDYEDLEDVGLQQSADEHEPMEETGQYEYEFSDQALASRPTYDNTDDEAVFGLDSVENDAPEYTGELINSTKHDDPNESDDLASVQPPTDETSANQLVDGNVFALYNCNLVDPFNPHVSDVLRNLAILGIETNEDSLNFEKPVHWKTFLKVAVYVLKFTAKPPLAEKLHKLLLDPKWADTAEEKNNVAYGPDVMKHVTLSCNPSRDESLAYSDFLAGATILQDRHVRIDVQQITVLDGDEKLEIRMGEYAKGLKLAKECIKLVTKPAQGYINKKVLESGGRIF